MADNERTKSASQINERKPSESRLSKSSTTLVATNKSLSRLKVRKPSYGFTGVPGVRPIERTSQLGMETKRPPLIYLPTYQLDPTVKFHLTNVQQAIDEMLDEQWTGHKYSQTESPILAIRLAGDLMRKVKSMQFNRYRIISVVTIGQKRSQSYNNAVALLWDYERDGYVEIHREVTTAFIQVTVFGIYLD